MKKEKKLIVSLHDVSPKYFSELEEMIQELDSRKLAKRSLFVIPNHEGYFLPHHTHLIALLQKEKGLNNELCLHGFYHRKNKRKREFQSLNREQALFRLQTGKNILENLGFEAEGFVPPHYKINRESFRAVKEMGFSYLIKNPKIYDLKNKRT